MTNAATAPATPIVETPTLAQMEEALAVLQSVRQAAREGIDPSLPWQTALAMMRLMSPQQYGHAMERWVINHYGWAPVHKSVGRGDCTDAQGDYWEIKASFINPARPSATFRQIRPLEDIAGYQLFVVAPCGEILRFVLTSAQMAEELALRGFCTHGKTTAEAMAAGAEQSLTIPWRETDETYRRWMDRYRDLNVPA